MSRNSIISMVWNGNVPGVDYAPTLQDRIVGSAFCLTTLGALLAPKSLPVLLLPLALLVTITAIAENQRPFSRLRLSTPDLLVATLLLYALVSTAWTSNRDGALEHLVLTSGIAASGLLIGNWLWLQSPQRLAFMAFWVIIAFALGGIYLVLDTSDGQSVLHLVADELRDYVHILPKRTAPDGTLLEDLSAEINRNIAAANLLLWPILLALSFWFQGRRRHLILGVTVLIVGIATMNSAHESSKLAFVLSLAAFAVATFKPERALKFVGLVWVAINLLAVPACSFAFHNLQLHEASWLQFSARDRIPIWADFATRTLEAPIFGAGVRTSKELNDQKAISTTQDVEGGTRFVGRHPHNVYLQVWFELGFVGVLIFIALGRSVLEEISYLTGFAFATCLAMFVTTAVELGLCWSMWQRWFWGLMLLAPLIMVMAVRINQSRDQTSPTG